MPDISEKDKDLSAYNAWKKYKSKENANKLVEQLLPLVRNDIYRYSNNVPYAIVEANAKMLILQAVEHYDSKSNASLATFVKSYMIKLNQLNEGWRSPITIPSNRAPKYGPLRNAVESLSSSMGREPTTQEIADYTSWPRKEVERLLKEIRSEYTDDRPFATDYNPKVSQEEDMIDFIYHDLSPQEKLLLERTTGYGGKKKLTNPELMKTLGMTQNQLSYAKKQLADKVERMMKG
jgi:DNA-directed RNA polymerase specialized sigma subunit